MTRAIAYMIFAGVLTPLASGDETLDIVLRLSENAQREDLSIVTSANREEVVGLLRDIATRKVNKIGTILPNYLGSEIVLLRLADPVTMKRITDQFRRGNLDKGENIEWGAQGAVIPYLAPDFFLDDGDKSTILRSGFEGVRVLPPSVYSALVSVRVIAESKQFSPETRAWAGEARRKHYPYTDFRSTMRQWWKQNEAHFTAGDYRAVRPPQPEPPAVVTAAPPAPASTPLPVPTATPKPEPVPASVQPVSNPQASKKHAVWPWIVGVAVAIGIVALAAKRRSL